jgi:hypothetical protein
VQLSSGAAVRPVAVRLGGKSRRGEIADRRVRLAESGTTAIDVRNTGGGHADIATSMKYMHAAENVRLREIQDTNCNSPVQSQAIVIASH